VDIPWEDLRLFLAVAETGSLSAAARRLRMAQPTVSRRLAELEATLGSALFARSVEGARLTPFGDRLAEPARRMAEWAAEAERAAEGADTAPRGVVRITAPPTIAHGFVAPFAAWLREKLPGIRLEVFSSVHNLDLGRREADLALRLQRPTQRDLVCVESLEYESAAFAARSYIERLPQGYGPADIDWIGWAPPLDHMFPNPQLAAKLPGFRMTFTSDDFLVQTRAAEAGVGALFLARVQHRFSRKTTLEELDLDFGRARAGLHLVGTKSALEVSRVRAVADLLVAELAHAEVPPRRGRKR
jgi:DNA-binding transcriptional LysR family regulator